MKYIIYSTFLLLVTSCNNSTDETTPVNNETKVKIEDSNVKIEDSNVKIETKFDYDSSKVLDYSIKYGNDISYAGNSRATVRVMLNVSEIPTDDEIIMTSYKIFKENTSGWNEVTIWTYLPEMDVKSSAFGICEISSNDNVAFFTNEASLLNTKWFK